MRERDTGPGVDPTAERGLDTGHGDTVLQHQVATLARLPIQDVGPVEPTRSGEHPSALSQSRKNRSGSRWQVSTASIVGRASLWLTATRIRRYTRAEA